MERRAYVLAALAIVSIAVLGSCGRAHVAMRNLFGDESVDHPPFSHQEPLSRGASCLECHENLDETGGSPRGLLFQHAQHQQPTKGNCMRCHQAVATAEAKVEMPSMESCADGCHQTDFAELRCDRCHLDLTRYALTSIKTWAHTRDFERRHGPLARSAANTCATCHDTSFCSDCHADNNATLALDVRRVEQATRGFIHPSPYEAVHAIDAASRSNNCDSCHRPTFCTSCHATRGVAAIEDARWRHPDGWLDPSSMSFHGTEARRSIASCAGCHDRGVQSVCVRCHQVGGTGGNPHPHNFSRRDQPENNRMCRTCHIGQ